jgi:branched-chain amino acid transport system permease protein
MSVFVAGLTLGCIYALVAGGLVLVFRGTSILNFAHGSFVLFGGYVMFDSALPLGSWAALAFSCLATGGLALLIHLGIFARLGGQPLFALFLITLGVDTILYYAIGGVQSWTLTPKQLETPWGFEITSIGGSTVPTSDLAVVVGTLVLLLLLALVLKRTRWGLAMQVTAMDHELGTILGLPVRTVSGIAWFLSGVLAACAGAALAMFPRLLDPTSHSIVVQAFPAAVIGGMDSVFGAAAGGIVLGLLQVYTNVHQPAWLGANFDEVMPYVLLLVLLAVRPQGFFGTSEREVHRV